MVEPFEKVMSRGGAPAIAQIGTFFERRDPVHKTLHTIVCQLQRTGIPYAVTGAMALVAHGYHRTTIDVDVLLEAGGIERLLAAIDSERFLPEGIKRKYLRDQLTGVKVDLYEPSLRVFDSVLKEHRTVHPPHETVLIEGVRYLDLPSLLATKLLHGLFDSGHLAHLADVVETIKYVRLPLDFAASLPEDVRPKYIVFWHAVQKPDPHEQGP